MKSLMHYNKDKNLEQEKNYSAALYQTGTGHIFELIFYANWWRKLKSRTNDNIRKQQHVEYPSFLQL